MKQLTAMGLAVGMGGVSQAIELTPEIERLVERASEGDAKAQISLGMSFRDGRGVAKDEKKAVEWYRKAADQGNADAMDHLGFMHLKGRGVVEDRDVAVGYFKSSAAKGHAQAMFNLGECYFSGLGVEQNYQRAIEQWEMGAKKKHAGSMWRLAMIFASGESVPKDLERAKELCKCIAKNGHRNAALLMGELEWQSENYEAAHQWWEKAAKQGSQHAKDLLEVDEWRRVKSVPGKHAYVEVDHIYQGWNNCGATSVAMFSRRLGADTTPYAVKRLCPANPIGKGTDWQDLLAVSHELGQKWELVTFDYNDEGFEEGVEVIRQHLDQDRPVVIDFTIIRMEDGKEQRFGHTLTVVGYHKEKNLYVVNNPNQPSPGIQLMSSDELKASWYSRGYSRLSKGQTARPLIVVRN